MTDSSLKPMSCLSHGLASFGEQSQAVCSTKFGNSAAGDTYESSLMQIKEDEDVRREKMSTVRKVPITQTKSGMSQGRSSGSKQHRANPETVFECLEKVSRSKAVVQEPEFEENSEDEESDSEGIYTFLLTGFMPINLADCTVRATKYSRDVFHK